MPPRCAIQPGETGTKPAAGITAGYVLAFWYSLHALGTQLPMVDVAVAYLAGSAIGAASPTPGGLGAVEAALTGILIRFNVPGGSAVGGCSCSAW